MKGSILISVGKSIAIVIALLGVIHDIATFTPLVTEGLECLSRSSMNAMTYMSLMCGTSLIVSGMVLFVLLKKYEDYPILGTPILVAGGFSFLNGAAAVVFMMDNPFAWMVLIAGVAMFGITIRLKKLIGM